ncbi:MAG: hypothetical protein EOM50_05490, partial [Erysipelotrichia bacterium]|nr:hypothetical protein [Erysipelotrichia bacterium]
DMTPAVKAGETVTDKAVIKMNYVQDLNQQKELTYTVEHWVEGEEKARDTQTVTKKVWVNAPDTLTVTEKSIEAKEYTGYKFKDMTPAVKAGETVTDKAVIKMNYEREAYTLTINYIDEEGNVVAPKVTKELLYNDPYKVTSPVVSGFTLLDKEQAVIEGIMDKGTVINVVYSVDEHGTDPEDPDKSDDVADKYQVKVTYEAINGSVSFATTYATLFDEEGNYSQTGTGYLRAEQIPTITANTGYVQDSMTWVEGTPTVDNAITADTVYTASFTAEVVTPTVPVDPETPVVPPVTPVAPLTPVTPTPYTPVVTPVINEVEEVEPTPTPKADADKEEVKEDTTPKGKLDGGSWALINLVCTVATILLGLFLLISKRKKEEVKEDENRMDEEELREEKRRGMFTRILSILVSILSVIVFVLTENMTLPMVFVDKWTTTMLAITLVQIAVLVIGRKWKHEDNEEEKAS